MRKTSFLFFIFSILCAFPCFADKLEQQADNTRLELFANDENEAVLKFSINDGWHIYYQNPGEIGKPTFIENLADDNDIEITDKSVPSAVKAYEIMDEYIYKNTAFFLMNFATKKDVRFAVNFVECADVCKPQKVIFEAENLPNTTQEEWQKILWQAKQTFPEKISADFEKKRGGIVLKRQHLRITKIIPEQKDIVSNEDFSISDAKDGTLITWQNADEQNKLNSFLIITPKNSYEVIIDYNTFDWQYFIYIVFLAFFGGIILNAMPCVFPILSLKLFGIIKNHDGKRHYLNALSYASGVLCSFLALAAILDVLKEGGEAIGWGFQLQSPGFVFLMMILFLLLFLYMVEALPFPMLANDRLHKMSGTNMFLTGFFAVLIASPCTGPFMGAAIGYAFMQSDWEMYAVFIALALGYALPFALAEIHPHFLQRILPKPGDWMIKLKIVLAIPLLLTSIWLACVLVAQVYSHNGINKNNLNWRKYNVQEVANEISAGKKVFIDFTADWCLTCMFNEKTRLNSKKFADFVRNNEVELFKADLTESNDEYNSALSSYGRDGIPVYIYYETEKYKILPIFFDIDDL